MSEKKKNLLKLLIIIILIFVFCLILWKICDRIKCAKKFENEVTDFAEKNEKTIFSINKIIFFSSADSKSKDATKTNFTIENLYAYTDIALYINNNVENASNTENTGSANDANIENETTNIENTNENKQETKENTLKSLKISNIKYTKEPEIGKYSLYYKNVNNFAKGEINSKNKIENELNCEITSENEANLDKPILYNNCANPITLSYINQDLKSDYTMLDTENPIIYNGKLLERCKVELDKIKTSISFDVEIVNNEDQKFRTTVYFDIPYESDGKSIYDGYVIKREDTKFDFMRVD